MAAERKYPDAKPLPDGKVKIETFTYDGGFKMLLIGKGDGGPGTTLDTGFLFLPMHARNSRIIMFYKNGEPTDDVLKARFGDMLPSYAAEAKILVADPEHRARLINEGF